MYSRAGGAGETRGQNFVTIQGSKRCCSDNPNPQTYNEIKLVQIIAHPIPPVTQEMFAVEFFQLRRAFDGGFINWQIERFRPISGGAAVMLIYPSPCFLASLSSGASSVRSSGDGRNDLKRSTSVVHLAFWD